MKLLSPHYGVKKELNNSGVSVIASSTAYKLRPVERCFEEARLKNIQFRKKIKLLRWGMTTC